MTNPFDDDPLSRRAPREGLDPYQVGLAAIDVAKALTDEASYPNLNFYASEMYMRALAGVANRIDMDVYAYLPDEAHQAFQAAADACWQYMESIGTAEALRTEIEDTYPEDIRSELDDTRHVLNAMQIHISIVASVEDRRRDDEARRGLVRITDDYKIDRSVRPHEDVIAEQRQSNPPYDEDGIRTVLKQFGQSFNAVMLGWLDTNQALIDANPDLYDAIVEGRVQIVNPRALTTSDDILSHAASSIEAARPRPS